MKCDTCKYCKFDPGSSWPPEYSWLWCSKRHWEGDDRTEEDKEEDSFDPWLYCADYENELKK